MGLIGIIIASLVNLFLASSMLQFIVSVVGVLGCAGLTAWDTQRLKTTTSTATPLRAARLRRKRRLPAHCRST